RAAVALDLEHHIPYPTGRVGKHIGMIFAPCLEEGIEVSTASTIKAAGFPISSPTRATRRFRFTIFHPILCTIYFYHK
ncbi:MAG TPA: hypothetical protein VI387_09685, partial [Candidatus Brocadiales bacterium]|nr:hypothetical protein [Candidatus Brocadiales bacterium]